MSRVGRTGGRRAIVAAVFFGGVATLPAGAQQPLRLPELQRAAVEHDARAAQRELLARAHELRGRTLRSGWLPRLHLSGEAAHQSAVVQLPIQLPGGTPPTPPQTRFQVALGADQLLYDGGVLRGRGAVEAAAQAEAAAQLASTLYPLRVEVSEAYFDALLLGIRDAEVRALLDDLDARLRQVRSRVFAGTALPGDTAMVQAERLRRVQLLDEIAVARTSALARLAVLTGQPLTPGDSLELPALADAVGRAEAAGGAAVLRARPEYEQLDRQSARLARESRVVTARTRPQLHAFVTTGFGRPGPFELFSDDVNPFATLGVRMQWQPWSWGSDARDRELVAIRQRTVATERAALAARIEREVEPHRQTIRQLERAVELDAQIVALREQVERQARRQFEERELTASQYLTIRTELFDARLAAERHRVELERARARFLLALGLPLE